MASLRSPRLLLTVWGNHSGPHVDEPSVRRHRRFASSADASERAGRRVSASA